jgi:hypothetical protein
MGDMINAYEICIKKLKPVSEHISDLGRTKIWSWVPMGPETKNDCAGEGQQQITALLLKNLQKTDHSGDLQKQLSDCQLLR